MKREGIRGAEPLLPGRAGKGKEFNSLLLPAMRFAFHENPFRGWHHPSTHPRGRGARVVLAVDLLVISEC